MNNVAAGDGEFSSGCESGWTVYLEKSWLSTNCSISYYEGEEEDGVVRIGHMKIGKQGVGGGEEEEEEDMSMLSDASSGPPHFIDDSGFNFNNHRGCFYPSGGDVVETNVAVDGSAPAALSGTIRGRMNRNKDVKTQRMMLDDTASSRPVSYHHKKSEFGHRNKSQGLMENHRMLDLSHGFSSTHIQDGPPATDFLGHQYQQTQFLGRKLDGVQRRKEVLYRSVENESVARNRSEKI